MPEIVEAISFSPDGTQDDLSSVNIAGNPDHKVDPRKDDFYKNLIDRRITVKEKMKHAKGLTYQQFDIEQLALKILTNAIGYGVFVELNVEELSQSKIVTCFKGDGKSLKPEVKKIERPGTYFHPLLGTLITGAARLMLAIAERLVMDAGLTWAFCDTDSIAIVKPENLSQKEFKAKVKGIQEWFTALNPYMVKKPLLKVEHGETDPVYCLALSAKRYALFSLNCQGRPTILKASAHGLGHLIAPYRTRKAIKGVPLPKKDALNNIGIELWQYDLWHRIISETLKNNPTRYNPAELPGFELPAVSRYGATTPELLRWCKLYNAEKPYHEQIRPFGFLYTLYAANGLEPVRAISPFDKDVSKSIPQCFDRDTGESIKPAQLKTYFQGLAQYHLHPETKFLNGNADHCGHTVRRHVIVDHINHIGKEAHRWEEQFYMGFNPEAQIEYGSGPEGRKKWLKEIEAAAKTYSKQNLAHTADITPKHLSAILAKTSQASPEVLARLGRATHVLKQAEQKKLEREKQLLSWARKECGRVGLRQFAQKIEFNPANLSNILSGKRRPIISLINMLESLTNL